MLVEKGAFGAPWWLVTNKEGVEEPFFGSDRYVSSCCCCSVGASRLNMVTDDTAVKVPLCVSVPRSSLPGHGHHTAGLVEVVDLRSLKQSMINPGNEGTLRSMLR